MSKNWVVVPTCLPIVLRRCHRCASGRFRVNGAFRVTMNVRSVPPELLNLLHDNDPGLVAEPLQDPVVPRRGVGRSGRTERPAWQSPYGPPPHRTHRGRWAPVPGLATSQSAVRRGYPCGRCD
ncbi:hypothetical protein SVIO_023610 [Streptomyces violaceusniger]|uniref:Uncharacterized protein n=1 Tax=Streptomyces violaceusniger TaxID=68280 RepID=A0A4D4KZH9_STRVO|nr:hypothetical protein SVIO_023610 [Streptomyces violaceusniger]